MSGAVIASFGGNSTVTTVPTAGNISANVTENTSNNSIPFSFTGGVPTSANITVAPTHGNATLNGTTGVLYSPTANYTGADSFKYTGTNAGGTSNAGTASITVNVAPVGNTTGNVTVGSTTIIVPPSGPTLFFVGYGNIGGLQYGNITPNPDAFRSGNIIQFFWSTVSGIDPTLTLQISGTAGGNLSSVAATINGISQGSSAAGNTTSGNTSWSWANVTNPWGNIANATIPFSLR